MAVTITTGFVVGDAIVVAYNIHRHIVVAWWPTLGHGLRCGLAAVRLENRIFNSQLFVYTAPDRNSQGRKPDETAHEFHIVDTVVVPGVVVLAERPLPSSSSSSGHQLRLALRPRDRFHIGFVARLGTVVVIIEHIMDGPSSSSSSTVDQYLSLDFRPERRRQRRTHQQYPGRGLARRTGGAQPGRCRDQEKAGEPSERGRHAASSTGNGYATVQNLMSALDNITINNGSAPAAYHVQRGRRQRLYGGPEPDDEP